MSANVLRLEAAWCPPPNSKVASVTGANLARRRAKRETVRVEMGSDCDEDLKNRGSL